MYEATFALITETEPDFVIQIGAYSSVVEHYIDIVGVVSSILTTPTIFSLIVF
jgi:hypothetical protein